MYIHKKIVFRDIPLKMKRKLISDIKNERPVSPVFFVLLGDRDGEQLEIISSLVFYSPLNGSSTERVLIGVAKDKKSAYELAGLLVDRIYKKFGEIDFKQFYKNTG